MPHTAAVGQTAALVLAVKNFTADRCALDFGAGTAVLPPLTSPDPTTVKLSLQIAPTAPLGRHDIWITCQGGARVKAAASLTLTAAVRQQVLLPDVTAVAPATLKRGASYTLTLQVTNFNATTHAVTTLDFGSGIQGTRVKDIMPPQWKVNVGTGAPTGRHPITISYLWIGDGSTRTRVATAAVVVESDGALPPPVIAKPTQATGLAPVAKSFQAPDIPETPGMHEAVAPPGAATPTADETLELTPDVWQAGSTYQATLSGRNFGSGQQVRFGAGVSVAGAIQVISPTLARFAVEVAANAAPGERVMEVSAGGFKPFVKTAVRARVLAAPQRRKERIAAQYPRTDVVLTKDKINLIAPEAHADEGASFYKGWLNDATVFRWEEENPGVANQFELRLYAGDHLLMSRLLVAPDQDAQYGPVPQPFYRPDTAFLDEIFNRYFDVTVNGMVVGHPHSVEWQVAGYESITTYENMALPAETPGGKPKVVKTTTRRETALSERRLLRIPYNKLGLSCGTSGYPEGSRNGQYVVLTNTSVGAPPSYVEDQFELSGEVNLDLLSIQAKELEFGSAFGVNPGGAVVRVTNLFVDWGDDSGVGLVVAERRGGGNYKLLPLTHRYKQSGAFVARLFMLSADDVQLGDPAVLADAVENAPDAPPSPWWESPDSYGGTSPEQIASRAVLLFCQSVTVLDRKDLVAAGPLLLESIEITGANGQGGESTRIMGVREDLLATGPGGQAHPSAQTAHVSPGGGSGEVAVSGPERSLGMAAAKPTTAVVDQGAALSSAELAPELRTPAYSECDSLQNTAVLKFYGCGKARITWYLEDLKARQRIEIGATVTEKIQSPSRTDLDAAPELGSHQLLLQSPIRMRPEMVGKLFAVAVSASVAEHCEDAAAPAGSKKAKKGGEKGPQESMAAEAQAAAHEVADSSKPESEPSAGLRAQHVGAVAGVVALGKPHFVTSEPFRYRVAASTPGQPCRFQFQTASGAFEVDTLRDVVQEGGRYRGRGSMHLIFPLGQGKSDVLVDLAFADWSAPDGSVVIEGTIDKPNPRPGEFGAHGMLVKLERLRGAAGPGSDLNLDLAARLPDGLFTLKSPSWQASAAVSAAGDWIAEAGGFGPAPIGHSSFTLASTKVTIDLSEAQNKREPGAYCLEGQPAGPAWMGLHFGNATIVPDTFSLFPAYQYQAQDWSVATDGVCGQATMTGGFGRKNYKDGELGFDGIDLRVQHGYVRAAYQGFYARVPPLYDAEFSGAPVFTDAPGAVPFVSWDKVAGPAQVEHTMSTPSGRITARSVNFRFGSFPGVGWGVRSDTAFSFEANHQPFVADVWVNGLVNGFDGMLSLEGGGASADIALGSGTVLGQTPMTLDAVHVGGFGSGRLEFDFAAKVRISSKLSENPLPVGFVLERKTYSYGMRGPLTQSFVQQIVYNEGTDKQVTSQVTLDFMQGDSAGGGQPHKTQIGNCAADDLFCGATDDMSFMGVSVSAEFRLGMKGGEDYFALRAAVAGLKITLPPCFMLFGIQGGLAHNFRLTDMLQESLLDLEPAMDGAYVFMAGLQAGLASDPNLLSFEAKLLISTTEQPMMTFKAWILSPEQSKSGDVWGFFTVGPGGFDGGLAGDKSVLGNILRLRIPGDLGCYAQPTVKEVVTCAQATWSSLVHFGGLTDWYVYLGQNVDGKRISATLAGVHDTESYVTLQGIGGFAFGAKSTLAKELPAGNFRAGFSIGAQFSGAVMWPSPIGVKADGTGWAKVYGCYKDSCYDPGQTVWYTMEFSDVRQGLAAGFSIGIGCPFPISSVAFGFGLFPCCNLVVDVDWCDYGL